MSLLASIIDLHNLFKILIFWVEKRIKQFSALGFLWQYLDKNVLVNVVEMDIQE